MKASVFVAPLMVAAGVTGLGWVLVDASRHSARHSVELLKIQARAAALSQRLHQRQLEAGRPPGPVPPTTTQPELSEGRRR